MAFQNESHRVITVETDIQLSDYRAFLKFVVRQTLVTEATWARRFLLPMGLGFGIASGPWIFGLILGFTPHWPTILVCILSTWGALVIYSRLRRREMLPDQPGILLGPRTISVDERAIRVATEHSQSLYGLECVRRVSLAPQHVFVMVDRIAAIIVPRRDFRSPEQCDQFLAAVNRQAALREDGSQAS